MENAFGRMNFPKYILKLLIICLLPKFTLVTIKSQAWVVDHNGGVKNY